MLCKTRLAALFACAISLAPGSAWADFARTVAGSRQYFGAHSSAFAALVPPIFERQGCLEAQGCLRATRLTLSVPGSLSRNRGQNHKQHRMP